MKKLISLRKHLSDGVQELKDNPEKLVAFIEKGETHNTPRENSLSFEYRYTATLVITDFIGSADTLILPILAWLRYNQADRADSKSLDFIAELLDNDSVDIEIKVELSEAVSVTSNPNGTVTASHNPEPIFVGTFGSDPNPLSEWELHNA